jgi:hypothetical protein
MTVLVALSLAAIAASCGDDNGTGNRRASTTTTASSDAPAAGYAAVRRYEGVIEPAEAGRRVAEGFVPIIEGIPGFVDYHWIDAGGGVMVSISVFDDQAGAEESTRRAASWVAENLAELLPNPPQVTAGAVVATGGSADPADETGTAGYAAVRRYEGVVEPVEAGRRVAEGFVPIIEEIPGFVRYYWIDAGGGVMVSASVFEDQAGAEESTRRAASWVAENLAELLPNAPQVTAGEVVATG